MASEGKYDRYKITSIAEGHLQVEGVVSEIFRDANNFIQKKLPLEEDTLIIR